MPNQVIPKPDVDQYFVIFRAHLEKCFERHGSRPFNSTHEAIGVIGEEYHELFDAIRSNNKEEIGKEMLDVMVSAMWGYISLHENQNLEER